LPCTFPLSQVAVVLLGKTVHTPVRTSTTGSRPCAPQCATPTRIRTPRLQRQLWAVVVAAALSLVSLAPGQGVAAPAAAPVYNSFLFDLVPSQGAQTCLPKAPGQVTLTSLGPVETMHVEVSGLPPDTEFDLFVIQVPDFPFGLSWYQGDRYGDRRL
jgi:hypothetical protein